MRSEYKKWLYNKEYRQRPEVIEKEKERKKMLRDIKCNCECGGKYTLPHKTKHEKTKLHINYLEEKEKNDLEKWRNIEPLI